MKKHIILTSYSAGGKSLIAEIIQKLDPSILSCKTATTRAPRPGHENEYFFISKEEFLQKKEAGFFIETNSYLEEMGLPGFLYGTPRAFVEEHKDTHTLLFNVDPNGAHALKEYFGDNNCVTVFVDVEDVHVLKQRIEDRRTNEGDDEINARLGLVDIQEKQKNDFDHLVINYQGLEHAEKAAEQILAWAA